MDHALANLAFLRVFLFSMIIVAVILTLILRTNADRNYRLGNKSVGRFETFLAFALTSLALVACLFLYYLDSSIPS